MRGRSKNTKKRRKENTRKTKIILINNSKSLDLRSLMDIRESLIKIKR